MATTSPTASATGVKMTSLHFPFTLRLYARVLTCLTDHNFAGLDLFYRIKDCWKERDEPHDLLLRPLERGLSTKIGEWCFNTLFDLDLEDRGESRERPYLKTLTGEEFMWFVEDAVEAAHRCDSFAADSELLNQIARQINEIENLLDGNEEEYWKQVEGDGRQKLFAMFKNFCRLLAPLAKMRTHYACEVGERILHDRQLCHFIAQTVIDIGFDGETVNGLRSQWVNREKWPAWVKTLLLARDRGKCAECGIDMANELRAPMHIDHMFPLARGGCNDLVNLQLLCSKCNLTKLDRAAEVATSVPRYTRLQTGGL
jgi:hypothetical protein